MDLITSVQECLASGTYAARLRFLPSVDCQTRLHKRPLSEIDEQKHARRNKCVGELMRVQNAVRR
jgi:hypothetical protein